MQDALIYGGAAVALIVILLLFLLGAVRVAGDYDDWSDRAAEHLRRTRANAGPYIVRGDGNTLTGCRVEGNAMSDLQMDECADNDDDPAGVQTKTLKRRTWGRE